MTPPTNSVLAQAHSVAMGTLPFPLATNIDQRQIVQEAADAAMRVLLEHLRDSALMAEEDTIDVDDIYALLKELGDVE